MSREVNPNDTYLSRLLKYIPSEIVMVFISIEGVLHSTFSSNPKRLEDGLWILSGVLLALTPIWLWRVMRVKNLGHLFLSTLSLAVWMFAMGGPFTTFDWYHPSLGAVTLPLYTLLVPIITGGKFR
ncbi:MAG: hypothetical protein QMD04_05970 [Anaerolineales bacterium]|nr:hypothetical protein [Anaerolineales bacterium]